MSLMDGQYYDSYCETYVTPDLYWEGTQGPDITRSILNSFDVNLSMWTWCSQLDDYTEQEVQLYLNNMAQLESEYPDVTFIYMKCHIHDITATGLYAKEAPAGGITT